MSTRASRRTAQPDRRRDPAWIALAALLVLSLAVTVAILATFTFLHPLVALFKGP